MTEKTSAARIRLITERLQLALEPQQLDIVDESDLHLGHPGAKGGGHYYVKVVSGKFEDKSAIERHKMIYVALGDAMGNAIHAISINARTPAEAVTPATSS